VSYIAPETTQVPVDTVSIQGLPDVVTTETPTSTTGIGKLDILRCFFVNMSINMSISLRR
jgi:hypothetical protein